MSKAYLSLSLSLRLAAYKRNLAEGKKKLGTGWYDPAKRRDDPANKSARWYWVPEHTVETGLVNGESHHGCWSGAPWKMKGSSTELRFCDNLSGYFRNVRDTDDILSLKHHGWYVDQHQSETTKGIVVQIPGRDGKPIFLYGVTDPWNKHAGMIAWRASEWTDDEKDAARWADQQAEYYAEFCREDDAKQTAESDIEEAKGEIAQTREQLRELIESIRDNRERGVVLEAPLQKVITDEVKRLRKQMHNLWARIENRRRIGAGRDE